MSNIRNLNAGNSLQDLFSALNGPNTANHPFFAAFNPEARDRGAPPSYPGETNEDPPEVPPPSNEGPPPSGPGHRHGQRGPEHHQRHEREGFGGRRGGFGHCGRGSWGGARRGGRCGAGPYGMNFGGFDMSKLGDFISQFAPEDVAGFTGATRAAGSNDGKDFSPEADIFDTEDSFIIHCSLPGAKKEDVGVNWDADKSELNIAGVIHRPGDEAFLKTLALDERKVGVFERKIKLGSKESPASVDSDSISAKMEEGILRVTIPKVESFVEVKKVDIE